MFDLIDGLPVHPLVVHAVVVLLPLAVLGTIAIAVRPAWRQRFGTLVLAIAVLATALIPVATQSGEAFEKHVGDPGEHSELGDQLLWLALPMVVLVAALVLLPRLRPSTGSPILIGLAVLSVVAAVVVAVQVYRVGESGARAAWGDVVTEQAPASGG